MRPQILMITLLALLAGTGCANLNIKEPLAPSAVLVSDQGYIYGRFEEIKGALNLQSLWIRMKEVDSEDAFEIQVEDGVHMFALEPGIYRMSEFLIINGGPKWMLISSDVRSVPILPEPEAFHVEAGHAYYLGNFEAQSDHKIFYTQNTLRGREDTFAETTAEIKRSYPGLGNVAFERATGVGLEVEASPPGEDPD